MSNVRAHNLANDIREWLMNWKMPVYRMGIVLQVVHLSLFLLFFYLVFTVKSKAALWILLMSILLVLATQIYFRGCVISRIEKTLTNAEETIFEYLLGLFGRTNFVADAMKAATSAILIIVMFLLTRDFG